ncbi:hypothetical protein BMS3Abin15_01059 [bacterium BMS3Abin15]|nr:hypothetical protein BMS3Abin15_01059 [bacterium BMS3Abin15]
MAGPLVKRPRTTDPDISARFFQLKPFFKNRTAPRVNSAKDKISRES